MRAVHIIALIFAIIGAINWGLVGLFQFDLVATLFGGVEEPVSRLVYILVGIAGVVLAVTSATFLSHGAYRHVRT